MKLYFLRIALSLTFFISVVSASGQWPQWRGPVRDGSSKETNLIKIWPADGPKLLWSSDTVGDGFSSTAIQNNMVFTTGKRDSVEILTALDLKGKLLWQKVFGRASKDKEWPQARCTPTVYKNKVYATSAFGDLACFDCKNGTMEWNMAAHEKFEGKGYINTGIAESPLIVDDKLVITPCGSKTTMVALNRLTGKTLWASESINDTTAFTSPVIFTVKNKKAIFVSTKKHGLLIDSNNGKIIWNETLFAGDPLIPLVKDNQIYFPGSYKKGGKLFRWSDNLNKGTLVWQDTISANILGGAVQMDNKIIVSGNVRGLLCLDESTGKILSHYDRISYSNLMVADNMLFSYEDKTGRVSLFRMNGNNFELLSSFKVTAGSGPRIAHMSIANGLLFVRHGKVLLAYDLKKES
jgi:outer membrane protein assembly factor BamB